MKLVLATPLYPPESGGPATYAEALVTGLPAEGIEVVLVKFSDVRHLPVGIRHIEYFDRVRKAAIGADLILALDPVSVGLPSALAARFTGKPLVVKIVGDYAWEQGSQRFGVKETLDDFVRQGNVPFAVACLRMVQNFVAHSAKQVLVPSNYLKRIITAWGVSAEKISVIHNSIEILDVATQESVSTAADERKDSVVMSVGRLVPWKQMDGVIRAVAKVREQISDTTLMIVGDGPQKDALSSLGSELLGESVYFTGARSHDEVLHAMRTSGIFVLNSSYEGLSHALIEALMLGCVIIATNVGGNPEVITDGENGVLISADPEKNVEELAAAITRLRNDPALRTRLSAGALSSARFSRATMLAKTAEFLKKSAARG